MKILGVKIDDLNLEEILTFVDGVYNSQRQAYIVTPGPEFIVRAQQDLEYKQVLNKADLAICDGIGLKFAAWSMGRNIRNRMQGIDLMDNMCQYAAGNGYGVYLMGGRDGAAKQTAEALCARFPALRIVGWSEDETVLPKITEPCLMFVALGGSVKQEKWISNNLAKMPNVKVAMGVGGAFDMISGRIKRAPSAVRKVGFEWLWRLAKQPKRAGRIYQAVVAFPWLVVKSKLIK